MTRSADQMAPRTDDDNCGDTDGHGQTGEHRGHDHDDLRVHNGDDGDASGAVATPISQSHPGEPGDAHMPPVNAGTSATGQTGDSSHTPAPPPTDSQTPAGHSDAADSAPTDAVGDTAGNAGNSGDIGSANDGGGGLDGGGGQASIFHPSGNLHAPESSHPGSDPAAIAQPPPTLELHSSHSDPFDIFGDAPHVSHTTNPIGGEPVHTLGEQSDVGLDSHAFSHGFGDAHAFIPLF